MSERKYTPIFKPLTQKKIKHKDGWGFDIETANQNKDFVCAVISNFEKKRFSICYQKEQTKHTFDYINPVKNYIIATNLGFDFFGVIGLQENELYRQQERNNILYAIRYKNPRLSYRQYLMFYDTTRFMGASVEKLGKICQMPKLEHPKCFTHHPTSMEEMNELVVYCKNDADISQQWFKRFIFDYCKEKGVAQKTTTSAIAMQVFKTYYLKQQYTIESPKIHEVAFKSYKGGRVEVFQRGTFEHIQYYDFNSLYPSVMREQVPEPSSSHYAKQVSLWHIQHREGMCYIEGYQEYRYIPILSIKHDNKLITPTGFIKGYFTFIELREALNDGLHLHTIGEGVIYSRTIPLLKQYAEDMYATRLKQKETGDPMEVTTKLLMNGLYGKFGQKYDTQSQLYSREQLTKSIVRNATCISELSHGYYRIDAPSSQPPAHSFPSIASYITAFARIKLWKALRQYQDRVIYCDTDSLFLTEGKHIPDSKLLGELKHEGDFIRGTFCRPKMYGLLDYNGKETIKIKGLKTKITLTDMSNLLVGKKITEQHFVKVRTALNSKSHHKFGSLLPNQIIEKEKGFNPNDTKRDWGQTTFSEQEKQFSHPHNMIESDYE